MTGLLAVKLRSVKSLPRFVYIYIHTVWDTMYNSFSSLNRFYCLLSSIFIILGNKALHFLRTWYMYIVPGLKFVNPSGWYPWISFALLKTKMNSGYPPDGFIIFGPWYCYNPQNIDLFLISSTTTIRRGGVRRMFGQDKPDVYGILGVGAKEFTTPVVKNSVQATWNQWLTKLLHGIIN